MINVIVNINDSYTWQCCVMLTSLFENNKSDCFHIFVLHNGLNGENRLDLESCISEKYGHQVTFLEVERDLIEQIHSRSDYDYSAYFRLFASSLLPKSVSKALYLDSDMVLVGDVSTLWGYDLTDYAIGAVEDGKSGTEEYYERLGFSPDTPYFNSGVILMNLNRLREMSFTEKVLDFMDKQWEKIKIADQDIFNALLHNHTLYLPLCYNTMDGFLRRRIKIRKQTVKEMREAAKNPVIIHFTGRKPWQYYCFNPYRHLWFKYQDMTPWAGQRPRMPFWYRWRKRLDAVLELLHLRTRKYILN